MRTEPSSSAFGKETMIIPFKSSILSRRLPFCGGILQFWTTNRKQPESAFAQRNRDYKGSWKQIKQKQREQNSFITRDQHFMAPRPFSHQDKVFGVSNSCLTDISERSSYQTDRKFVSSSCSYFVDISIVINSSSNVRWCTTIICTWWVLCEDWSYFTEQRMF